MTHLCGDPTCNQDREQKMVVVQTGTKGKPTVWCDPCIAKIVAALNIAGIATKASCCGHGHRPGSIVLADGRELVIARSFEEARQIDALFPTDINGDHMPRPEAA